MYILKLALQKLASRKAGTLFSVLLFAVGCGIISLIIQAGQSLDRTIERNLAGVDLVIGAKGSPMQLILSSVMHVDYPTGNISYAQAQQVAHSPMVKKAVPIALGDNYKGYRIVGAPLEYPGLYQAELQQGQWYQDVLEVTVGAEVARVTGLGVGDTFYGVHGFHQSGHAHPNHIYTVSGIMKKGLGVLDQLILTPVSSVWKVHEPHDHSSGDNGGLHQDCDHDHQNHVHNHTCSDDCTKDHPNETVEKDPEIAAIRKKIDAGEDISHEEMLLFQQYQQDHQARFADDREITAMLLQFHSPAGLMHFTSHINDYTQMQAASPALEVNRLMSFLGVGFDLLRTIAWLIILISGIHIFIQLWNTLREELYDIALMRVLGATKIRVFLMLLIQGFVLALLGWLVGVLLARVLWFMLPPLSMLTDTALWKISVMEMWVLAYVLLTGIGASLIPAINAYRTDVHYTLK